jgi:hypothetical protein
MTKKHKPLNFFENEATRKKIDNGRVTTKFVREY